MVEQAKYLSDQIDEKAAAAGNPDNSRIVTDFEPNFQALSLMTPETINALMGVDADNIPSDNVSQEFDFFLVETAFLRFKPQVPLIKPTEYFIDFLYIIIQRPIGVYQNNIQIDDYIFIPDISKYIIY